MTTEFRAVVIQNDDGIPPELGIHRYVVLATIVTTGTIPHPVNPDRPLVVDSKGNQHIANKLLSCLNIYQGTWYQDVSKNDLRLMTATEIVGRLGRLTLKPWRPGDDGLSQRVEERMEDLRQLSLGGHPDTQKAMLSVVGIVEGTPRTAVEILRELVDSPSYRDGTMKEKDIRQAVEDAYRLLEKK